MSVTAPKRKVLKKRENGRGKRGSKICAPSRLQQADTSEICVAPFDTMHAADPKSMPSSLMSMIRL
eukprot:scaffold1616_cov100-Skeletonema_dohrnii-CCMP3373.AAC.8